MTKIFVYGSLLRGFGNWSWALINQKFIAEGETLPEYDMISLGSFPGVLPGGTTSIKGEVFEVTDACLLDIDRLEGADRDNPREGFYRPEEIVLADGTECWMYMLNASRNYPSRPIPSGSWREYTNHYLQDEQQ